VETLNVLSYVMAVIAAGFLFEACLLVWLLVSLAIIPKPSNITIRVRKPGVDVPEVELALNVGCGADMWGDVRLDQGRYSETCGYRRRTTSNIIASAELLPFRDGIFREARAFHVLEHVPNPQQALDEILRVSHRANVRVPIANAYSMFIEFLRFNFCLVVASKEVPTIFSEITRWPKRYSDHKWCITFDGVPAEKNTFCGIPRELEIRV
jgi:hypothetical protein